MFDKSEELDLTFEEKFGVVKEMVFPAWPIILFFIPLFMFGLASYYDMITAPIDRVILLISAAVAVPATLVIPKVFVGLPEDFRCARSKKWLDARFADLRKRGIIDADNKRITTDASDNSTEE